MSFSNPKVDNPISKYIEFRSDDKKFIYYDKEQEKRIDVPTPFYLVVLDELATVTGYCEDTKSAIRGTEVKSVANEQISVKTLKGSFSKDGLWKDIKEEVENIGGKFTKSVYALYYKDKTSEPELVNIRFAGASIGPWLDFKFNQQKDVVVVTNEFTEQKKGKNVYYSPVFSKVAISDDKFNKAMEEDARLQEYFEARGSKGGAQVVKNETTTSTDNHNEPEDDNDQLPF